jgi:methyl-accepting chemotaxis protein
MAHADIEIRDPEVEAFFSSLKQLEEDVGRIWIRQIETGRTHSEQAVIELAQRFETIVRNLEDSVRAADTTSNLGGNKSVKSVLQGGEEKMQAVVASLEAAMGNKDALMNQVGNLNAYIRDLKGMAEAVASLAEQTNILALNAAIEAARAGESGRGFAVVAGEVRSLSKKSGETGRKIGATVKIISDAISTAFTTAAAYAEDDTRRVERAEQDIGAVMGEFRDLADHLETSASALRHSNLGIKRAIEDSMMHLQFQDRVSQILSHVRDNIALLATCIEESERTYCEHGRLQPLDWSVLTEALLSTYATHEEHENHNSVRRSGAAARKAADGLTFF